MYMNKYKYILLISAIITILLCSDAYCSLSQLRQLKGRERIDALNELDIKKTTQPYESGTIKNFFVDKTGNAVVFMEAPRINIYDQNGTFLYGYSFTLSGDYLGYGRKDRIFIKCLKNNMIYLLPKIEQRPEDRADNNGLENVVNKDQMEVYDAAKDYDGHSTPDTALWKDKKYSLTTKLSFLIPFSKGYNKFTIADSAGNERVVLDTFSTYAVGDAVITVLVIAAVLGIILYLLTIKEGKQLYK